ncbi:acylglycerol lipase [Salvia divinorum]|uniref:Acylglycerol lipase n=1 Tax=Salvia divinorum TaxID=28513 RepID=A0ABD1HKJ2_SALDI
MLQAQLQPTKLIALVHKQLVAKVRFTDQRSCPVFFHGYGIAKHIAACGYGVYAIDHPSFGLSEGLHGYIPSFDVVVDNVIEQFKIMKDGAPERYSRLGFQRIEQENFVSMPPYIVISYSDQTRLKTIVELLNATKYIEESPQVASPILIPHGASNRVTDPQEDITLYLKGET